ncbi:MAG: ATP-binding protein [Candidatus Altiarchaeota archaeon]|nr:ATP-binding protein [Candidatus Altiarchaeota archaeon]
MNDRLPKTYVITGASGSGKTATLRELQMEGHFISREAAAYLRERADKEGLPEPDVNREQFQKDILDLQLKWENGFPRDVNRIFMDRGIPDGLAYFKLDGKDPPNELLEYSQNRKYDTIFQMNLLEDQDGMKVSKKVPLELAKKLDSLHEEIYTELDYNVIRVPAGSVSERSNYILKEVGKWESIQ